MPIRVEVAFQVELRDGIKSVKTAEISIGKMVASHHTPITR